MNKFLYIFLNPFIISLPIAVFVILLLPSFFDKFKIDLVKVQKTGVNQNYYHDIDHDSFSESIYLGYENESFTFPCVKCRTDIAIDQDTKLIDQYNSPNNWLPNHNLVFGDFNDDQLDEIYFFEYSSDSLFLKGIDLMGGQNVFLYDFIALVSFNHDQPDFYITSGGLSDMNYDGYKELIFCIQAGFSREPRAIFVYDIKNNKLSKKDLKYASIYHPVVGYDNSYGNIITISSVTPGNVPLPDIEYYCDSHSWLFAIDENLDFLFPPIEHKRKKSTIQSTLFLEQKGLFLYAIFNGETSNDTSWLIKFNTRGEEIKRLALFNRNYIFFVFNIDDKRYLILYNSAANHLYRVSSELEFIYEKHDVNIGDCIDQFDLNNDGKDELITYESELSQIFIYQNDFTNYVTVDFPDFIEANFQISKCNFKDNSANLYIQSNGLGRFYLFLKNDLYYFKYPFYIAIYLLISLFLYALLKIQKHNLRKKFEQEKRMTELELLTIKSQIDPHFTFNAINTLSSIFYKEDKKTAHEFLVDFSSLIRNTLNNSKKIAIPLIDEIDFVRNYLKLQQFRYSNKFEFKIQIDKEVNQNTLVPRMIIQTFAENSVKHGLVNKEGKGNLTINIRPLAESQPMTPNQRLKKPDRLQIKISDDGIGREKSRQVQNYKQISTGKGHDIIKQIVEMYNRLEKAEVSYKIEDMTADDRKIIGTLVTIYI